MLDRPQQVMDRLSLIAVWIGGGAMLGTAFLVGIEVVIRKLFNMSLGGADEISGYVFAIATASAYALVLRRKGNVRIDVVYNLLPRSFRLILDIASFLALGALLAVIGWFSAELAFKTYKSGAISVTPLQTPLALPQFAWIVGMGLALLMWTLIFIRVVGHVLRRNWPGVFELIGNDGIDGEISAELGDGNAAHVDPEPRMAGQ